MFYVCPKSFWKKMYFFVVLWCHNFFYIFPICLSGRPMVLKELASEISPILSIIYNVSIKASEIPNDWRSAVITPAFKKTIII
jgi:hypothetical protein